MVALSVEFRVQSRLLWGPSVPPLLVLLPPLFPPLNAIVLEWKITWWDYLTSHALENTPSGVPADLSVSPQKSTQVLQRAGNTEKWPAALFPSRINKHNCEWKFPRGIFTTTQTIQHSFSHTPPATMQKFFRVSMEALLNFFLSLSHNKTNAQRFLNPSSCFHSHTPPPGCRW